MLTLVSGTRLVTYEEWLEVTGEFILVVGHSAEVTGVA
jgi:hypothetical protein